MASRSPSRKAASRSTRSAGAQETSAATEVEPQDGASPPVVDEEAVDRVTRDSFNELCRELNMDSATRSAAWSSYVDIGQKYTLEGNQLHWLACALYVACHNSGAVEGNGVSLTRLLRSFRLSLIQFFNKAKKWADMSNLKSEFRDKVDSLERNFAVSNVIFKKYQPIFVDLFKDPSKDPPKVNRSRKQKKPPCTPGELFDFCWGLFVRVKTDFPAISDDLVNSYHLLLSCVDYIYGNAVLAKRTDLLNEDFAESHPLKEESAAVAAEAPCILDSLCRMHDGIILEVKSIREHWWKPHIRKFFEQKLLRGDERLCCGILDPAVFDMNAKEVRKDYEAHVLSIGEYDERVFLGEDANEEIGTPTKLSTGGGGAAAAAADEKGPLGETMQHARRNLATQFDGSSLIPTTPLSGKHYLKAREQLKVTPVSTATYLVSRLNSLLGRREAEPSPRLLELFRACDADPTETVLARVKEMGDQFGAHYVAPSEKHPGSHDTFARMRLKLAVVLYYKLLESILYREKSQNKPLGNLLSQDIFHRALFTCCLEIVIFSYNSQRTFPWILDIFKLEPFHFYKVIEIIIRTEDSLPRDVVKHLQRIEEQTLESRAWASKSPLWEAIAKDKHGVPSGEEVSLSGQSISETPNFEMTAAIALAGGQSPLSHHKRPFSVVRSPMAGDRFKSPVVTAVARRQLAFDGNQVAGGQIVPTSPIKPPPAVQASSPPATGGIITPSRPKRTGSLALFFRKVYHLAHLRLDALCFSLKIRDEDTKRKIWTVFENTIMENTELMKDRHLDQILMCSVYIVNKVLENKKRELGIKFTDILEQYRNQPQAASHVFRSVLLGPEADESAEEAENVDERRPSDKRKPPPTPTRLAATSTLVNGEERGDLIKFYNKIFCKRLNVFVNRLFGSSSQQGRVPPLSPLPKLRAHPQSPCRKVSESHSVYIRPLKSSADEVVAYNHRSPHKPLQYSFSRSPAKNLDAINRLMRTEGERRSAISKRLLADETGNGAEAATETAINDATQVVILEGEPPAKLQIIGTPAGNINQRLGIVIGDRSVSDQ